MLCYLVATVSWRESVLKERCFTERESIYPHQTPSTFLACLKEIPVASRILTSTRRAITRILSSARLPQPALFRATHPSLTLLQSALVRETSLSLPSLHQPALFRATTLERLQQRALCRPLSTTVQASSQSLQALSSSSLYSPERASDSTLPSQLHSNSSSLTGTPSPPPLPPHCVVSVRAAATLELLMV